MIGMHDLTDLLSSKDQIIAIFRFLRQGEQQQMLDAYNVEEWREILAQAQIQQLAPLLYQRLVKDRKKEGLPDEVARVLQESYYRCLRRNLLKFNELHKVLLEFQKNGIPILLLKGSYLAKFIYQNIGLRPMVDLDLMVERDHLQPALEILRKLGYGGSDLPLSAEEIDVYKHAPTLEKPGLIWLELHWKLTDKDEGLQIEEQDLWQRVKPVQFDNVKAMVLAPEDLVLHICVHAAYGHLFSVQARSVVDLAEILIKEGGCINWETIIDKADRWQAGRGAFLMLYLAQYYLNAPVPNAVLTALRPVDFDPLIIDDIFWQFCRKEYEVGDLFRNLENKKLFQKFNVLIGTFFPSRVKLSRIYQVDARSWKLLLYYPILWRDKVFRQWRNAINLLTGSGETGRSLKAINTIQTWLQIPGFKERP